MEKTKQSWQQTLWDWCGNALGASILITAFILAVIWLGGFLRSDWVGAWKPILDPQLIFSVWVAELPIAYFVKYILGERIDRPVLRILDAIDIRRGQSQVEPVYYGVTVLNNGDIVAEDCDVWINVTDISDFPISWQPTRPGPVNIRPERKETTQICRVVPLERVLEFPSDNGWNSAKPRLPFAPYRIVISIGATNCKPAKREFKITFNESGKETLTLV